MPGCVRLCGWEGGSVGRVGVLVGMGVFTGRGRRKVWVACVRFYLKKYFPERKECLSESTTMG